MDEMYCIVVCSPVHKRPRHLTGNGGVLGNVRRKLIETAEIVSFPQNMTKSNTAKVSWRRRMG